MVNEGIEFKDHISSIGNEPINFKQIVLGHIKKISNITCQELTGGYWEEKPLKVGNGIVKFRTYKPDLREAYSNAVDFLIDLVYFEINKYEDGEELKKLVDDDWGDDYGEDVKRKLKKKRELFRKINFMFHDIDYFNTSDLFDQ